MPNNSYFNEFKSKYERPQVDNLIVGFSGIDPQRKPEGSGGDTLSDEQLNAIQNIIQNEFNSLSEISGNCNCDWSNLSDEQKAIVLQLISDKLRTIKVAYDGGEIEAFTPNDDEPPDDTGYDEPPDVDTGYDDDDQNNDDNNDNHNIPSGDFFVDNDHEALTGLLGGNSNGHFHVTDEELIKLAEYPDFSMIKHQNLPDLAGGDSNGHLHLTLDELCKLRIMIEAFFPDGSNEVIIKPATPDNNPSGGGSGSSSGGGSGDENDDEVGSGNFGLPASDPPGWSMKIFPNGREAHANSGKLYYGYFPSNKQSTNGLSKGLLFRLNDGYAYFSDELTSWTKLYPHIGNMNSSYNITQYLYINNSGIFADNHSQEFIPLNGNAKADIQCRYSYVTSSGGTGNNIKSMGKSGATFVAGAYSELLQCVILVDSANRMVARKTKGITTVKKVEDSTNIISANLGCAAWNPVTQVFCITGKNGSSTSPDGESWTANYDVPMNLKFLTFREDLQRFFAWSQDDNLFYSSTDGINWDFFPSDHIPLDNVTAIDWSNPNGWYCAVGKDSQFAYFSKDLKHWIPTKIRNNSPVTLSDVIYMPSTDLYVAIPTSGSYYYTFNPSDWTD